MLNEGLMNKPKLLINSIKKGSQMIESKLLSDGAKITGSAKSSDLGFHLNQHNKNTFTSDQQSSKSTNHYQGYLLSSYKTYLECSS